MQARGFTVRFGSEGMGAYRDGSVLLFVQEGGLYFLRGRLLGVARPGVD